jgi:ribose transport system substrate-binding protein
MGAAVRHFKRGNGMRSLISVLGLILSIAFLALIGCSKSDNTSPTTQASGNSGTQLKIAVIPKGTTHVYWRTVNLGAQAAAKDLGVQIIWKGPVKENDRGDQIAMVEQFVTEGVDGIVLAPLDATGLVDPVQQATDKKISVVVIDSALKATPGKDFVSFVATNNHQAGYMGGEQLAKQLNGKGKVVLLRYQAGSASTDEREAGFLEAIAKSPDITIISSNQMGGATTDSAKTIALNMMDDLKKADGIFCPNESTTLGMLGALEDGQLAGKVKFVGFDATPALVTALRNKEINVLIAQDPYKMGYEGVKACVNAIRKQPVEPAIDTGTAVVNLENVDPPAMQKVLGR